MIYVHNVVCCCCFDVIAVVGYDCDALPSKVGHARNIFPFPIEQIDLVSNVFALPSANSIINNCQ